MNFSTHLTNASAPENKCTPNFTFLSTPFCCLGICLPRLPGSWSAHGGLGDVLEDRQGRCTPLPCAGVPQVGRKKYKAQKFCGFVSTVPKTGETSWKVMGKCGSRISPFPGPAISSMDPSYSGRTKNLPQTHTLGVERSTSEQGKEGAYTRQEC